MERINTKKVKKYIAVGSLVAIAATGLSLNHKYNPPIEYEINEETNENDMKGEITFNKLSNYRVITVQDLNGEYKYYIGKYNEFTHVLTDLLTGDNIPGYRVVLCILLLFPGSILTEIIAMKEK